MAFFLYTLEDPRTSEIRYVGQTVNPTRREKRHQSPGRKDRSYLANWVRSLIADGVLPHFTVRVQLQDEVEAWATEKRAIAAWKAKGYRLVNGTAGGDGVDSASSKEIQARPEVKAKISAAQKAAWADPGVKVRHVVAVKASWADPEARAQRIAAIKTVWARPGYRARMSVMLKAANARPEVKARKSASAKAANARPEVKAQRSASLKIARLARRSNQQFNKDRVLGVRRLLSSVS